MTRLVAGIIAATLAAVLLLQWLRWPPAPTTAAPDGTSPAASTDEGQRIADQAARLQPPAERESYASILERPIFRPDRKPLPPDDQPQDTGPSSDRTARDALDLTAVLITPAQVSAWVADPTKPKPQRWRLGDEVSGWQVREIRGDRVLLERQGETYPLLLRDYSKQPPGSATPTPTPRRATDSSSRRPAERQRPVESRPNAPTPEP